MDGHVDRDVNRILRNLSRVKTSHEFHCLLTHTIRPTKAPVIPAHQATEHAISSDAKIEDQHTKTASS
jgi:hypothetical protein